MLFLTVFAVALARYLRRPDRLQRDVVLVFAAFAAMSAVRLLLPVAGPARPALGIVFIVAILAQGPLIVRLARHFRQQPRWLSPLAWLAAVPAFVVAAGGGARTPAGLTFVVGVVVLTDVAAAALFARAARTRIGVARVRLGISAVATAAFAAALLATGLSAATTTADGDAPLGVLARVLALIAGGGYVVAFLPPARLLQGIQRSIAFEWQDRIERVGWSIGESASDAPTPESATEAIWTALADAARGIAGARSAVVTVGGRALAASGEPIPQDQVAGLIDGTGDAGSAAGDTRVIRLPGPDDELLAVVLRFEGTPLFVDDDVALISLLAHEARRAIARDRAARERSLLQQQLAMERHRADAETRFREVLDAQPTALLAVGPRGRVLYANSRAVETFATTHERILGGEVRALLPDDPVLNARFGAADGAPPDVAVTVQGGADHETLARRPDGSCFPVEVGVAMLPGDEGAVTLVTLTDISQRKSAEVIRDRFIDLLSHELRTPVTALYGFASLLGSRTDLDPAVEREVLGDMVLESDRLQRMVENLIALARAERGVAMGGDDPVLLQRLVPRIVAGEQRLWPGARFEHHLPPDLATVRGDDDYLGQVLRNLLSNAAKYGGQAGPVEITAEQLSGRVRLAVADHGPGFPEAEAESLFELYYRSEGVARDVPGAGIGLFVCRRIVEAMGGRISARLRPGGGAIMELELPVYDADEMWPQRPAEVAAGR